MELSYTFQRGKMEEARENAAALTQHGLFNSAAHQTLKRKVQQAESILKFSEMPFQRISRVFCCITLLVIVALAICGVIALNAKSPLQRMQGRRHQSLRQKPEGAHCKKFWQCKIDSTSNKTHADICCDFKEWNHTHFDYQPNSPFEPSLGLSALANGPLTFNTTNQVTVSHHRRHHHPLFLTINNYPFFLSRPCPIPPCVRKWIICLAISLHNCIIALIVLAIIHCRCRRRTCASLESQLNEDSGATGMIFKVQSKCKRVEITAALRGELSFEGRNGKKLRYVLVDDVDALENSALPLREEFRHRN